LAWVASADDPEHRGRERGAGIAERISRLEPAAGVESGHPCFIETGWYAYLAGTIGRSM